MSELSRRWQLQIDRVNQDIEASINKLESIYIGFSGGVDSACLLHMLNVANKHKKPIIAIHINHNISVDSKQWVALCENHCAQYDCTELIVREVIVAKQGDGLENAARKVRWDAFQSVIKSDQSASAIYLAHHADDQVETVLMRLLRGAGIHGLKGIPETRMQSGIKIIRPLLSLSKVDLQNYARKYQLTAIEDESNTNVSINRNYVRHMIMPQIKQRWPNVLQAVHQTVGHLNSDWEILHNYAREQRQRLMSESYGVPVLMLDKFNRIDRSLRVLLLRTYCIDQGWYASHKRKFDTLVDQLEKVSSSSSICYRCRDYKMLQYQNHLYIMPSNWFTSPPTFEPMASNHWPSQVNVPNLIRIAWPKSLMQEKINNTEAIVIVTRKDIECHKRIQKRIKKYFQSSKIPTFMRSFIPMTKIGERLHFATIKAVPMSD